MSNLQVTKMLCPQSKWAIKCPFLMNPKYVTVHNTANDASAMNEIAYMISNDNQTSFHAAVDYERVVQGIDFNRNSWNAGDGLNGAGNRESIAIEICYSKTGGANFDQAEVNGAMYIASILKQFGWGLDKVKKHQDWSGKYCPHRTLDMGWQRFLDKVALYLNGTITSNEKAPTPIEPTPTPTGMQVHLPASATSWRIYPLNVPVTIGNEIGRLAPSKFGGLTYGIVELKGDVATIKTRDFGLVQIYVSKDSGAIINGATTPPTSPATAPSPAPTQQTGKKLTLPASATSWRVYPLNKDPKVGNEVGRLNPSLFGGLVYDIIELNGNIAIIQTRDFGKVQIYVAADTGAIIN